MIPVTQAGYYYPVASGVPACFSGDTLVDTPAGKKRMDQLEIGDLVLTSENNAVSCFSYLEAPASLVLLHPGHSIPPSTSPNRRFIYSTGNRERNLEIDSPTLYLQGTPLPFRLKTQ